MKNGELTDLHIFLISDRGVGGLEGTCMREPLQIFLW